MAAVAVLGVCMDAAFCERFDGKFRVATAGYIGVENSS